MLGQHSLVVYGGIAIQTLETIGYANLEEEIEFIQEMSLQNFENIGKSFGWG